MECVVGDTLTAVLRAGLAIKKHLAFGTAQRA
jgi:hypothetical protein